MISHLINNQIRGKTRFSFVKQKFKLKKEIKIYILDKYKYYLYVIYKAG